MPRSLKAARVLMAAVTVFAGLLIVALFGLSGLSAESLAGATWLAIPASVNGWLAYRLPGGGVGLRRAIIALQAFYVFLGLGALGLGDPSGFTGIALAVLIVVLVTRKSAAEFFRAPKLGRRTVADLRL